MPFGYNYRLSNVLAGIGRADPSSAPWGRHTRWLTTLTIDPEAFDKKNGTLMTLILMIFAD